MATLARIFGFECHNLMTLMYVWNGLCGVYVAGSSWTTSCSTWNIAVTVEENAAKLSKRTWELKRESSKNKSLLHTQVQQMSKLAAFPPTGWLFSKGLVKYGTILPLHILDQQLTRSPTQVPTPSGRRSGRHSANVRLVAPGRPSVPWYNMVQHNKTSKIIPKHPKTSRNPI